MIDFRFPLLRNADDSQFFSDPYLRHPLHSKHRQKIRYMIVLLEFGTIVKEKGIKELFRTECINKHISCLYARFTRWHRWRYRTIDEKTRYLAIRKNNWDFSQLFRANSFYFQTIINGENDWIILVDQYCELILDKNGNPWAVRYELIDHHFKKNEFQFKPFILTSPTPVANSPVFEGKEMIAILKSTVAKTWIDGKKLSRTRKGIYKCLLDRMVQREMADELQVSIHTIHSHMKEIRALGPKISPGLIEPISVAQFFQAEGLL